MVMILIVIVTVVLLCFLWFHLTNPFARITIFQSPYRTFVDESGNISYIERYRPRIFAGPLANFIGYVKSGFLIVQNTFFVGNFAAGDNVPAIINDIHKQRFDPSKPYLISGDQFAVLYPRNLGVFYNQLLNPDTALNQTDWENRQRIYLQSVLFAIDGLSASPDPRTTVIPIGPRQAVLTQVHPGGIGSDQVYGLFYALHAMRADIKSGTKEYHLQTKSAVDQILETRHQELRAIYTNYISTVFEQSTSLVKHNLHLSAARDGVVRSSSLYDNIVMYETVRLAEQLGLEDHLGIDIDEVEQTIKQTFWNEHQGYYNDDLNTHHFSADWLIGFATGFFDLRNKVDLERTIRTVSYVETSDLVQPFPIKYQIEGDNRIPRAVKWFVPNYGNTAIWSYWGSQYIALLAELYHHTGDKQYLVKAKYYIKRYERNILRDQGFAETYDSHGDFLKASIYKSIRVTGWIVEFEYAKSLVRKYSKKP